jgi:uncharacterized protein YkwD
VRPAEQTPIRRLRAPRGRRRAAFGLGLCLLAATAVTGPAAHGQAGPGQAACPDADLQPAPDTIRRVENAIFCVVNGERKAHGAALFARNRHLDRSATFQSADMVRHHYFAHEARHRPTLLQRVLAAGYFDVAVTGLYAENLAVGPTVEITARNLVDAWMQSPDHRANLLDSRLRDIGLGTAMAGPDPAFYPNYPSTVFTADFGRRIGVARTPRARGCVNAPAHRGSASATPPRRYCPKGRHPRRGKQEQRG